MTRAWYVLWVHTGSETDVLRRVQGIVGVEQTLAPLGANWYRKDGGWELREGVLIPGYIFIRCAMSSAIYYPIRAIPRVIGWLGNDHLWPSSVPENEMQPVLRMAGGAAPEDYLTHCQTEPRKRRGRGTLRLGGRDHVITYNIYKQPEETQVDQCPVQTDGDHDTMIPGDA